MSNFACEICGVVQCDSERGYIAGCCHYPPESGTGRKYVNIWLSKDSEGPVRAFYYKGQWYRSEEDKMDGLRVHPVRWSAYD